MRTLSNLSAVSYSTFRFNATLASVTEFESIDDLSLFNAIPAPIILGEGSNTVFMQDITAPVCRFIANNKQVTALNNDFVLVHVDAGHNWHQLVTWAVQQHFWGIENLALIPGSVGAAPVQNIGAYGVELADSCVYVDFYDWQSQKVKRIPAGRCQFGYRDSLFKHGLANKGIIVAVGLCLSKQPSRQLSYKGLDHLPTDASIDVIYQQVIAVRSAKLPDPMTLANCGSFFKNPTITAEHYARLKLTFPHIPGFVVAEQLVKVPAAWLIEQQGFKGKNIGDVGCYKLQPLVLVNHGAGTAEQLTALVSKLQQQVYAVYQIALEPEVRMLAADGRADD